MVPPDTANTYSLMLGAESKVKQTSPCDHGDQRRPVNKSVQKALAVNQHYDLGNSKSEQHGDD